ncbi:MAG: CAP domain-containing protein [Salinirussus sp.]
MAGWPARVGIIFIVLAVVGGVGVAVGPGADVVDGGITWLVNSTDTALGGSATTESTPAPATAASDLERAVHKRVNEARMTRNLDPLDFDGELREIARFHSRDMAERGYFSHLSPDGADFSDRYDRFGYECHVQTGPATYATGGENLFRIRGASGLSDANVADRAVAGWLDSPSHRRNLLHPDWRREGIGVARAEGGSIYITQNFC